MGRAANLDELDRLHSIEEAVRWIKLHLHDCCGDTGGGGGSVIFPAGGSAVGGYDGHQTLFADEWDTLIFPIVDQDGAWYSSSGPDAGKFKPTIAGEWQIELVVEWWGGNAAGFDQAPTGSEIMARIDGAVSAVNTSTIGPHSGVIRLFTSGHFNGTTDYVTFDGYTSSGAGQVGGDNPVALTSIGTAFHCRLMAAD